jgi:hypothetical protein
MMVFFVSRSTAAKFSGDLSTVERRDRGAATEVSEVQRE